VPPPLTSYRDHGARVIVEKASALFGDQHRYPLLWLRHRQLPKRPLRGAFGVEFVDRVHGDQRGDGVIGAAAKEADVVVLEEGMRAHEPLERRFPPVAGPAIDGDTKEKEILHRADDAGRDDEC
jgi:hypothetical protein